jgi:hypothetical protein
VTIVAERCSRCANPCDLARYYIQDFREGFIVHHVYCSERCAKSDLSGDNAPPPKAEVEK